MKTREILRSANYKNKTYILDMDDRDVEFQRFRYVSSALNV
jgi:hypothetical protein